jgi:hypothetical protein
MRTAVALLLSLVSWSGLAAADGARCGAQLEPIPSERGMEHERRYRIHDPGSDFDGEEALVRWSADLDGDGAPDLALDLTATGGSAGKTMWSIYVSCPRGRFRLVWGPEYVTTMTARERCTTPAGANVCWRDLRLVPFSDKQPVVRLRYDGARYR